MKMAPTDGDANRHRPMGRPVFYWLAPERSGLAGCAIRHTPDGVRPFPIIQTQLLTNAAPIRNHRNLGHRPQPTARTPYHSTWSGPQAPNRIPCNAGIGAGRGRAQVPKSR